MTASRQPGLKQDCEAKKRELYSCGQQEGCLEAAARTTKGWCIKRQTLTHGFPARLPPMVVRGLAMGPGNPKILCSHMAE